MFPSLLLIFSAKCLFIYSCIIAYFSVIFLWIFSNWTGLAGCSGILLFSPLALLTEIAQVVDKHGSVSASLRPSLVLKSRRCKCRPYFASTQDVVIVGFKFQHYSLEFQLYFIWYSMDFHLIILLFKLFLSYLMLYFLSCYCWTVLIIFCVQFNRKFVDAYLTAVVYRDLRNWRGSEWSWVQSMPKYQEICLAKLCLSYNHPDQ